MLRAPRGLVSGGGTLWPVEGYGVSSYGDAFADVYDDWYADLPRTDQCADHVTAAARGGRVLELGVGTGRLALAVEKRGVGTVGLDASFAMLARFRDKRPDHPPLAVCADMAAPPFGPARFAVVLVAFNTFFNLGDLDAQRACLESARALVDDGGCLFVETIVFPDADRAVQGVDAKLIELDRVVLTASRLDPVDHTVTGQHIEITDQGVRLRPWRLHYLLPHELDALAAATGWRLVSRHEGWDGEPFTDASDHQVATYRPV